VIERERKFLVGSIPADIGPAVEIRQGYLAVDGDVEVRIREADDDHVLTIKGGRGRDRTEVERSLDEEQFNALWPLTAGRRLQKGRHRVPLGAGLTAEVDVYRGRHEGLLVVEVELPPDQDPDAFIPPDWFGRELTDDPRYSNAALASAGELPDR
jgi:CYTH domain-containing protein